MSEKKISWALSLQIGYLVYQYTKLRILQFYYDFLDKFVSHEDFQLWKWTQTHSIWPLAMRGLKMSVHISMNSFTKNTVGGFQGRLVTNTTQNFK